MWMFACLQTLQSDNPGNIKTRIINGSLINGKIWILLHTEIDFLDQNHVLFLVCFRKMEAVT